MTTKQTRTITRQRRAYNCLVGRGLELESLERREFLSASVVEHAAPLAHAAVAMQHSSVASTAAAMANPVTISQRYMGSYTELDITGTSGDDSIYVSQSGYTLTITANGRTSTLFAGFGDVVIHGGDGNDTIVVNSSLTLDCRMYGDAGSDVLTNETQGRGTVVSLGDGSADVVSGNGINTSFWVSKNDKYTASKSQVAGGYVHQVAVWYLPANPSDSGWTTNMASQSLWGTGPTMDDVNQGQVGDCYLMSTLASLATSSPNRLREMAVDLGDGNYVVQFKRGGKFSYVRVTADLPNWVAHVGGSGDIWALIIEKAYAFFRTGQNTYDSLNAGFSSKVFSDLGISSTSFTPSIYVNGSNAQLKAIQTALASGHAVTAGTDAGLAVSASVVESHAYSVVSAFRDARGAIWYAMRNPWGVDGVYNYTDPSDGIVYVSAYQLGLDFSSVTIGA